MSIDIYDFARLTPTGVRCPVCELGHIDPARGRYGPIYKCTNLACGFWVDSRPTGARCTYEREGTPCGALLLEGTKTIRNRCSDKTCPNRHPHKLAIS